MLQGAQRGNEVDLTDQTYDGVEENGYLVDGLGQLADGERGENNFRLDLRGNGKGKTNEICTRIYPKEKIPYSFFRSCLIITKRWIGNFGEKKSCWFCVNPLFLFLLPPVLFMRLFCNYGCRLNFHVCFHSHGLTLFPIEQNPSKLLVTFPGCLTRGIKINDTTTWEMNTCAKNNLRSDPRSLDIFADLNFFFFFFYNLC